MTQEWTVCLYEVHIEKRMHFFTRMAEHILHWVGGGAYKQVPKVLTCRGSGDICKIDLLCTYIFCLKLGRGGGG